MFEELSKGFENYSGALDYMRKCYFAPGAQRRSVRGLPAANSGWVRYGTSDN